jgi:ketosteroid isomerase-like protein
MADTTAANLALVEEWEKTFNHDIERMVNVLYAPDAELGGVVMGPEKFLRFERRVLDAAPKRAMRVERTHAVDDVVAVEAVLVDPDKGADWKIPFCAVLTFREGRIVRDMTYGDFTKWPGMH